MYGTKLDRELGSADRSQLFTTALRKEYVNEGQQKFNERTGCFVKRATIAISDGVSEYDLEAVGTISAQDYLRPARTSASLKRYDGAGSDPTDYAYAEGPDLPYKSEEDLNQSRPGWRSEPAGTPDCWTLRTDGGSQYLVLVPPPDVPSTETWTLLWPYVAQPADMTADADEPYTVSSNPLTTLRPYHDAILFYAAAQCEKLRKNTEGWQRQMGLFEAEVIRYRGDIKPPTGSRMRLAVNPYGRLRGGMNARVNPLTWP